MKQPGNKNMQQQTDKPVESLSAAQSKPAGSWSLVRAQALRKAARQRKPSACNCY